MSEKLKHKIFNFEVTPPGDAWNAISERIDDDTKYSVVTNRLNNFEEVPPQILWDKIAVRLDDDNNYASFSDRMNNFEATPPSHSWQNIITRLDDDKQYDAVATRLSNFDTTPPPFIWNNIAENLHESKEEKTEENVITIRIRKNIYRLAAAAIMSGLFIGAWILINKNVAKNDVVKTKNILKPVSPVIQKKDKPEQEKDTNSSNDDVAVNNQHLSDQSLSLHDRQHTNTKNTSDASASSNSSEPVLKHAIVNDLLAYQEKPIVISSAPILDNYGNVIRDMDVLTTSNYIMVTGPNGQATRMSSKFANVVRYLNGSSDQPEEYIDRVIKESNTWKKRFQEWRDKISKSSYIPSSANFLDIIEFKDLIQDNQ